MSTKYSLPADAVWFITGGSSGIGRAFATYLSNSPYRLVVTARRLSALGYLPDTSNILKLSLDITSVSTIQEAVSRTLDAFGCIDVVINNAGYSLVGDTESTTDEQARRQFETTFWGAANLTREVVRVMRDENPKTGHIGGVIIYTSAAAARITFPGGAYYYASRFAMDGFLDSFSKELDPSWNVHLMSSLPGGVKTDYFEKSVIFTDRHPAYLNPNLPTNQMQAMFKTPGVADLFPGPETLVEVVIETVKNGIGKLGVPLRLPLGADSWTMLKSGLERILAELEVVKETSFSTKVDAKVLELIPDLI